MTGDNVKIAANWQFLTDYHGPSGKAAGQCGGLGLLSLLCNIQSF